MDTAPAPLYEAPAPAPGAPPERATIALWNVELEVVGQMWFPKWTGPAMHLNDAVRAAKLAFYGTAFIDDADTLARYPVRLKSARRFADRRREPRDGK